MALLFIRPRTMVQINMFQPLFYMQIAKKVGEEPPTEFTSTVRKDGGRSGIDSFPGKLG